jgi:hypothetical protein
VFLVVRETIPATRDIGPVIRDPVRLTGKVFPAIREPCRPVRDSIPVFREAVRDQNSTVLSFREAENACFLKMRRLILSNLRGQGKVCTVTDVIRLNSLED